MKIYNTLTRKKQEFKPIKKNEVGLYACGPTVYWHAHIGNLRSYIFEDILRRTLEYNGYKVKHVINITDVGHLTSDADTGEDKMEKGAKRENKTAWDIAKYYTEAFKKDLKKINVKTPTYWTKATDYIPHQIKLIQKLEKKGYTYLTSDGIYFDTSKSKDYGELWGSKKINLKAGARVEVISDKRNPEDFALWKFSPKDSKRDMEWNSPWGKGFPGWHTECIAMSVEKLGIPFDIHCGGIDHIQIHHTNEIAQSKALYGKNLSKYWMHGEFLNIKEGKMSKSKGDGIILETISEKKINPLAYRYLCLTAHYRSHLSFSWDSLKSAENSLNSLKEKIIEIKKDKTKQTKNEKKEKEYLKKFKESINDDLNIPKALSLVWVLVKDKEMSSKQKVSLCVNFDEILGLDLNKTEKNIIPEKITKLVNQREKYRANKNWQKADEARKEIEKMGYVIEDGKEGQKIKKKN